MSLIELIIKINQKVHHYIEIILELDLSALEREFFGYSVLDLCALYLALVGIKHLIIFMLNITTKLFTAVAKMGFHYLSLQLMLYGRIILLRAVAVLKYIYRLAFTQLLLKRIREHFLKQVHRFTPHH